MTSLACSTGAVAQVIVDKRHPLHVEADGRQRRRPLPQVEVNVVFLLADLAKSSATFDIDIASIDLASADPTMRSGTGLGSTRKLSRGVLRVDGDQGRWRRQVRNRWHLTMKALRSSSWCRSPRPGTPPATRPPTARSRSGAPISSSVKASGPRPRPSPTKCSSGSAWCLRQRTDRNAIPRIGEGFDDRPPSRRSRRGHRNARICAGDVRSRLGALQPTWEARHIGMSLQRGSFGKLSGRITLTVRRRRGPSTSRSMPTP